MAYRQLVRLCLFENTNPTLLRFSEYALATAELTPEQVIAFLRRTQDNRLSLRLPVIVLADLVRKMNSLN